MDRLRYVDQSKLWDKDQTAQALPPAFADIYAQKPGIVKENRGRICVHAPVVLMGSMLIAQQKGKIEQIYAQAGELLPNRLATPISFLQSVPIFNYEPGKGYSDLGILAETVMFQQGCSIPYGLATTGDYSGLFLEIMDDRDISKGMCINRIWNDSNTEWDGTKPYDFPGGYASTIVNGYETTTRNFVTERIQSMYHIRTEKRGQHRWTSEIFLELADELQIPVSPEFTTIRHPR